MNAVEIEEAITALAKQPFDPAEFPFAFLQAFGNKETTLKRLRKGESNKSDLGGVLQTSNIHIAIAPKGETAKMLAALRSSPATARAKAKFILTTDGEQFEAEDLSGDAAPIACAYGEFPDHFGYFLPLAGITTVQQVRESSFDIRATSRLNRLYIELRKDNPAWDTAERRHDMNNFMARLIFCFFAEDTDIFPGGGLFTTTVEQMSARDSSNTHEVIKALFLAMNTKHEDRESAGIPRWADRLPYVNGGLFSGDIDVPKFSKIARSYLLHIGSLDWTRINPDIFGSMIQAVAEDEERGALGMHYTSVPNILKVLNPLFLDELRAKLEEAGTNPRTLLNLRKRMSRIRVFDPACGSGNFLVIAYKEMRAFEATLNERRGEKGRKSEIPLTNFRGIELRDFPCEIARLALIIAEYQCDVLYRGQQEALDDFLPLDAENWITCGNALRLDWLSICPPTGTSVKLVADGLFSTPLTQAEVEFENQGGETYICGNPPYRGFTFQTDEQKSDIETIFARRTTSWRSLDYVTGWFMKAAEYGVHTSASTAFVTTNSVCQGEQVPNLWPQLFAAGVEITFAHTSFKWANLASHNAGVTVAVVGISNRAPKLRRLFSLSDDGAVVATEGEYINAYLVHAPNVIVQPAAKPPDRIPMMVWGNKPSDGGNLILTASEAQAAKEREPSVAKFIFDFVGSQEFVKGIVRRCLWIHDSDEEEAKKSPFVRRRLEAVKAMRMASTAASTRAYASLSHRFRQVQGTSKRHSIVVPKVTSETRPYLPVGVLSAHSIVSDNAFALYDAPLWCMALIASRLHIVWVATVCGKLKTDYRYSNSLGWNTFPTPVLTDKNKEDLSSCAEDILLAREAHFPATIADLYDPEAMPDNLRHAHEHNDEVLERIYIGRRFRNDTERLEKLFDMYTKKAAVKGTGRKSKGTTA